MSRPVTLALCALATCLAVPASSASAAAGGAADDPVGGTKTILLGATAPLSGPSAAAATVSRGAEAYFRYVNARGGVNGHTIVYRVLDDGGSPAQTALLTRQLVERDRVFAMFGSIGTDTNLAVRQYLNDAKVPQLLVFSGATSLAADAGVFPYTSGFQPTYRAEGWVYGKYLARAAPGATVAVLFENGALGRELLAGLKQGLQRSRSRVVAAQPVDPVAGGDVTAQLVRLRASGADTLAVFTGQPFAAQAYLAANRLGWKPRHVVACTAAATPATMAAASDAGRNRLVNGTISIAFAKDPGDPQWANDGGMRLYRSVMARHAPNWAANDPLFVHGMAAAWTVVEVLRRAGTDLGRDDVVKALETLSAPSNPFLLPGIAVRTGGRDRAPIEQMMLQRWQAGGWRAFGGLWTARTG